MNYPDVARNTRSRVASVEYATADRTDDSSAVRSAAIYRYFAVPQAVFEGLIAAESKGVYFNRNVRDRFRHQRLA